MWILQHRFDSTKGFGSILLHYESCDMFFHQTKIHRYGYRSLDNDELVEFRTGVDESGNNFAVDVLPLEE